MTVAELLAKHGIKLPSMAPGRHYTTCPQCSHERRKSNAKPLGVTIEADGGVHWGCNHCSWTGPEKGAGKDGNGHGGKGFGATYDYTDADGALLFQKVRNAPRREPRSAWHAPSPKGGLWPWSRAKRMPTACAHSASSQPVTRMARAN